MVQQNFLIIHGLITRKYEKTRKTKDGTDERFNSIVLEWEDMNHYKKTIYIDCKGLIAEEMGEFVRAECYISSFETNKGNWFTKAFSNHIIKV